MTQSERNINQLKGSQTPRIRICPDYAMTYGDDAAYLAEKYGLKPDEWQLNILRDWLGRDENGFYAAETCGLSVPRQNGKNALLEMRELYGALIKGERILHTAQEVKTHKEAFMRICSFFENRVDYPELADEVDYIRKTNGEERIVLNNGGAIYFSARSRSAMRGSTFDVCILDEAQELTDEQMAALKPTQSASALQNPQLIMVGTPPTLKTPGEVFENTRKRVLTNLDRRTCWHEWSVEQIGDVSDRKRWEATNPALGTRLLVRSIESELSVMTEESFAVERLGRWQQGGTNTLISEAQWQTLEIKAKDTPKDGILAYGVKFSPDGSSVSLAVALKPKDGVIHVELIENRSMSHGILWLADWLFERRDKCATIVIDGKAGALNLVEELNTRQIGKRLLCVPSTSDVITSSTSFVNAVLDKKITHIKSPALDVAVAHAQRRPLGNNGGYGFKGYAGFDVTPVEACALAFWGVKTTKRDPRRKARIL